MPLKRKIQELQKKREEVLKGGGDAAIEKQAAVCFDFCKTIGYGHLQWVAT